MAPKMTLLILLSMVVFIQAKPTTQYNIIRDQVVDLPSSEMFKRSIPEENLNQIKENLNVEEGDDILQTAETRNIQGNQDSQKKNEATTESQSATVEELFETAESNLETESALLKRIKRSVFNFEEDNNAIDTLEANNDLYETVATGFVGKPLFISRSSFHRRKSRNA